MASVRSHLWFGNDKAIEAASFYAEHIPDSAVTRVFTARTDPDSSVAEVVEFTVGGHEVIGLNAGPEFHLNEAFSFYLRVEGQEEVDHYWEVLTADGGEPGACAGARTSTASRGRSSLASSRTCPATTAPRPTNASARPC